MELNPLKVKSVTACQGPWPIVSALVNSQGLISRSSPPGLCAMGLLCTVGLVLCDFGDPALRWGGDKEHGLLVVSKLARLAGHV